MEAAYSIDENEKRNNLIAWAASFGFHLMLLLFLFFAVAWKKQIPPPPEYGMEVNFGLDDQGFGDVQEMKSPGPDPQKSTAAPAAEEEKSTREQESEPEKIIRGEENVASPPPAKAAAPEKVSSPSADPAKTAAPKAPASESLFPSEKGGGSAGNNGNKPGTTGDMGKKNGNPDVRGIYDGNAGSGSGGSSLEMNGWKWDDKPKVRDDSNEEGRIVFEIKVDEDGSIISVRPLEKSVSLALVKKYQKEVESLSFSRTKGGSNGAGATGKITFIIKNK